MLKRRKSYSLLMLLTVASLTGCKSDSVRRAAGHDNSIDPMTVDASGPSVAQELGSPIIGCPTYIGQTVTLNSFDSVVTSLKAIPTGKGEYETTAAFEARVATAKGGMPDTVTIPGIFSAKYINYDADTSSLKIQAYALRNLNTEYSYVFGYGTPYYGKVKYSSLGNRDVVVFEKETSNGTYVAANAYGAKVTVTKITRIQKAIFEGEHGRYNEDLFVDQKKGVDALLGSVPMSIPAAQALKEKGKIAFVVKPKWPFYAEGIRHWGPKIANPTDVSNPIQVIVGDIQCGLLLNPANKVVAAYTTR